VQAFAEAPSQAKPVADITVHDATPGAGPATTDEPALADQIVQSLRLQLTSGGGEAQLRLRPEYLGELTVKVVVEDGVVSARLEAAAPAVREWVERHEGVLRQALADHGLSLDTLSVHESAPADDANQTFERHSSRGEEREDERPRRRRQATGSWGRFAVDTDESDAS
jgi:flagellar hook-length control protein FliK